VKLVLRAGSSRWRAPIAVVLAVIATFVITAVPIRAGGASPAAAYWRYLVTPLTSWNSFQEVLLAASPLLLTGLAVAIAFRSGYYNIGAEGQFLAGAIGAAVPGLYAEGLDAWLALPLALACGAAAGLLWALLPAWLKRVAGIDEVVTTLLLNPVALLLLQGLLNGPWRHPESGFPDSARFGPGYELPTILGSERVHAGLLIGIVAIAVTAVVLSLTPLGLRIKAAGQAPAAARFSGIRVGHLQWWAALVSGAVAGLAGACQVLGVQHQLTGSIAANYGYTGIVVASLAALTPGGVLLVGLLLGDIAVGAQNASLVLQIPQQMGDLVTAVLLLTVVSFMTLRNYRIVWRRELRGGAP
jgi:simple sugar transport system permease protein